MASRQCRGLDPAMVIGPTSYMMVIAPCCEPSAPQCVEPARQRCCSLPYRFCMHQQLRRCMHAAVHGWMPEDAQPNPDTPSLAPSLHEPLRPPYTQLSSPHTPLPPSCITSHLALCYPSPGAAVCCIACTTCEPCALLPSLPHGCPGHPARLT